MAATLAATLSVLVIIRLSFTCCEFTQSAGGQQQVFPEPVIQSECRDRYLWIHISSDRPPQFEAVDGNGVHSISKELAPRCGYTISTFKMDGFTTFRASYYSCFTQNQGDEVFSFRLNVILTDPAGRWISHPVSAVCPGLSWTHREMICEEDYMEVNVNRESSCGGQHGDMGATQQEAFTMVVTAHAALVLYIPTGGQQDTAAIMANVYAQRTASSAWQLMFLQSGDQVFSMSISEAQRLGYSLTTTATRVVLRSPYKQSHAELIVVDGVVVEVVRVWLFFKQRLMVVMLDVTMACTVNSGSFDRPWLLWDIPMVMTPLVGEGVGFESQRISVGVEGRLLDEPTATARGITVAQQEGRVQIRVPFGAEGGYRKSLVVNNVYKDMYMIFLLYEHVFAQVYEDGSSVETRLRLLRVLDTPLTSRQPFTVDQTVSDEQAFRVYLGNIPVDVFLEDVYVNGKKLEMSAGSERGYGVGPVLHANGSRAYELRVPFQDAVVHRAYLGEGILQYSLDLNYTLTIMPQGESYYHHAFIMAYVHNAFPPQITSECSHGGITFTVVRPPIAESLWEVGVGQEALTSQLAAQRGYRLQNDSHKSVLEVPVFSVGYTYEEINLVSFYGTFNLLLRDSRTLEVQTSTAKRCIFKTQDMIVCSTDGTMTAVTTLTTTWPTVQPDGTTLLDPTCGPKQTDGAKVLFEFKLNSCGTRAMVGESYVVYENEILHERQLIADGPNVISRDSQFKLTVRCFYPLGAVSRLFVDRIFRSETQGLGSIKLFESIKGTTNAQPANAVHAASTLDHNTQAAGAAQVHPGGTQPRPQLGHFTMGGNMIPAASQSSVRQTVLNPNLPLQQHSISTERVPLQVPSDPGHLVSQKEDHNVLNLRPFSGFPNRYSQLPDSSSSQPRPGNDNPTIGLDSFSRIVISPGDLSESSRESAHQGPGLTLPGLNSLGNTVWHSGLKWDQNFVQPNLDLQRQEARGENHLPSGAYGQSQRQEAEPALRHYGSVSGTDADQSGLRLQTDGLNTQEGSRYRVQSPYDLADQYSPHQLNSANPFQRAPKRGKKFVLTDTELTTSDQNDINATPDSYEDPATNYRPPQPVGTGAAYYETSQVNQNPERIGSFEGRNIQQDQHRRPQNIRVRPQRKLTPSGYPPNQQSGSYMSSQHISPPPAVSGDERQQISQQQNLDHRGSDSGEETRFQALKQDRDTQNVRVKPHQSAASFIGHQSQNQQGHQQRLVPLQPESGDIGGQSASIRHKIFSAGVSLIRVRPSPGGQTSLTHPGRLQLKPHHTQTPAAPFDSSRTSYLSVTPQSVPKDGQADPTNRRQSGVNNVLGNDDTSPSANPPVFPGSNTASAGSGSVQRVQHQAECSQSPGSAPDGGVSNQYGASVHQGILRGQQIG